MRILGWRIEGYGLFANYQVNGLSPGLNIFLGANEAGKSTLLEFLREMLFGIELSRNKPKRYPARPGLRHGGRLFVETEDGPAVIERYGEKGSGVRISNGGRQTTDEAILERWLRGAGADLFRNVFAIGLGELTSFQSLTQAEVRDRIFSAGIAGAGRSAREVVQQFQEQADELLRPRSGGRVNALLEQLAATQKALEEAREKVRRYPDLRRAEEEARERMDALAAECERLRAVQRQAEDLIALWPEWVRQKEAAHEREDLARRGLKPELEAEIEAACLWVPLYQRLTAELAEDRNAWESACREWQQTLKRMGPGTDENQVRCFDLSIPRRERIRQFQESMQEARERRMSAALARDRAQEEARKAQMEWELAEKRRSDQPSPVPAAEPAPRRSPIPAFMFACAACAALAGAWLAFANKGAVAGGLGLLALLLAVFGYLVLRELKAKEMAGREALRREQEQLRARIEIEKRNAEDAASRLKARQDELAAAERALAKAEAQEQEILAQWRQFSGTGAPPEIYLQLLREAERAQALLEQRQRLEAKIRAAEEQIGEWESQVRRLAGDGEPLARLSEVRDRIGRWKQLDQVIRAADTAIAARLGGAADWESFHSQLASGDVDSWKRQRDEAVRLLEEKAKLRDAAVREEAEARRLREALEASADVAKLEMELSALRVELEDYVRAWRVATLARALCESTLQRVRRERQPSVIAEAARLFQSITSGRYSAILTDDANETLTLEMASGGSRTLEQLSRGTAEQLYLCLRLAFAREFSRNYCNLPLVMDDVLVNFDPQRARLTARVLAGFARETQVLLFTCHPETAAIFEAEAPGHLRVELPAPSAAGVTAP